MAGSFFHWAGSMKRIFFILWGLLLSALVICVSLVWVLNTNSGAKTVLRLVNSFSLVEIDYTQLDGPLSSMQFKDLKLDAGGLVITAEQASVQWNPFSGLLQKHIRIDDLQARRVKIINNNPESRSEPPNFLNLDLRLPLDIEILKANLYEVEYPAFIPNNIKEISLSANLYNNEWTIHQLNIEHPKLTTKLNGTFQPHAKLTHSLSLEILGTQFGPGTLITSGDSDLTNLVIDFPEHKFSAQVDLSEWLNKASVDLVAKIDSPNVMGVKTKLDVTAKGNLNQAILTAVGNIDGHNLNIKTLEIAREANIYSLLANGDLLNGPFNLISEFTNENLNNSELNWIPKVSLKNATVQSTTTRISGPWKELSLVLNAQATANKQAATLKLNAQLSDLESLKILPSSITTLGGQFELSGSALLSAPYDVKLSGIANNLKLAKLDPRLPDLNKGIFDVRWSLLNNKSVLDANFSDLKARIKDRDISGQAQLQMSDDFISKASLSVRAGKDNYATVQLLDQTRQIIDIDADINDLAAFIGGASGRVKTKLQLHAKSGLLDGNLEANSIEIPGLLLTEKLALQASQNSGQQIIELQAQNLNYADNRLDKLDLKIKGQPEQHQFEVELQDNQNRSLSAQGDGQWINKEYSLNIKTLNSISQELGTVSNQSPLDLHYTKNILRLKPFCLSSEIANLCGELQKSDDLTGQFELHIQASKNKLLGQNVGTANFIPQDETHIKATFKIDGDHISSLDLQGRLEKLAVFNQDEESLDIEDLVFTAIGENDRIAITLGAMVAGGSLDINGVIQGPLDTASIEADIKANLPNLELVSPLLIATDIRSGSLLIDMRAVGKLKAPRLSGLASITDTNVSIPELGINQLINAEFKMIDFEHGEITGTVKSGEGTGRLSGKIGWEKEPIIDVILEGEKLLIADIESLALSASPKLAIHYSPGKLDITGNINIDRAFSSLASSGSSSQISSDVIIVDEESDSLKQNIQQKRNININTAIINPARIEGHGVKGEVTGKLHITQKDSGPILANGQLEIKGQYQAFGQVLQIESGRLNYINTELDNPSIEFYASRQIADVKVGVRVTGRPNTLVSKLESTPSMREAEILNYLVLGKPPGAASEAESGQLTQAAVALALARSESGIQTVAGKAGLSELSLTQELGGLALSLGKQFSPRLFIGYTMGFVDPVNVARVRYMLSSKWALESEISEETRALIKYRFETD